MWLGGADAYLGQETKVIQQFDTKGPDWDLFWGVGGIFVLLSANHLKIYLFGEEMEIYTDGGCIPNPGTGAWAYVIVKDSVAVYQGSGYELETTNNRMEYLALIRALEKLIQVADPRLGCRAQKETMCYSDSMLLVNQGNGVTKRAKKNKDLVAIINEFRLSIAFKMIWVRGHDGNKWNEFCDQMCADELAKFGLTDPYV